MLFEALERQSKRAKDESVLELERLHKDYVQSAKEAKVLLPSLLNDPAPQETERAGRVNASYLQAVMVEAIEDFGGSAHPSSIAQYAMKLWYRRDADSNGNTNLDEDPLAYDFQDFRKGVKLELKRNSNMFERVSGSGQFVEWMLTPAEVQRRKKSLEKWTSKGFRPHKVYATNVPEAKSLPEFLREVLHNKPSGLSVKQLEHIVQTQWVRNPQVLEAACDACELLDMTLRTNPMFHDHDRDPSLWELALGTEKPGEKRLLSRSANLTASPAPVGVGVQNPMGQTREGGIGGGGGGGGGGEDPSTFKRPERSRRRERSASPTKEKEASPDRSSRSSMMSRNKKKKETSSEGQWIQCDRCKKWVSTLDDNIPDLSLYDDHNPYHLEYFCPTCRDEEAAQDQDSKKRPSSKRVSTATGEIGAMLDELEAELMNLYRNSRTHWKRTYPVAPPDVAELEKQFRESIAHFKARARFDDVQTARHNFKEFFNDQLSHLRESIARVLKSK